MPVSEFNQYMKTINSDFILSEGEKKLLNKCLENMVKNENYKFTIFNINKDFYELNYSKFDVEKKFTLSNIDFTSIEDWASFKSVSTNLPEE